MLRKRKSVLLAPEPEAESAFLAARFRVLMQAVLEAPASVDAVHKNRFGVAVSGGADSMALAWLLHDWVKQHGGEVVALTVDHGLRRESAQEAREVAAAMRGLGVPHTILNWIHPPGMPPHVPHQMARHARYQLLLQACHDARLSHLFLAHHADDQAETHLIRQHKQSGADGLAAMPATRLEQGVILARPLLPIRKHVLQAFCEQQQLGFVVDPSNHALCYVRGQLRQQGLDVPGLYHAARQAGLARQAAEAAANAWLHRHAHSTVYGGVEMDVTALRVEMAAMQHRLLARAMLCVGGGDYPPRTAALAAACVRLAASAQAFTLHGCHLRVAKTTLSVWREAANLKAGETRFILNAPPQYVLARPATLGLLSRAVLKRHPAPHAAAIAALPEKLRATLPALFQGGELVAIPHFVAALPESAATPQPFTACFTPKHPLRIPPFHVAPPLQ